MRKFKLLSTLLLAILCGSSMFAQDFSNKGKEFWLCFPQHVPSGTLATLSVWITSDKASSGTITMTNGAFSANFTVNAGNNYLQQIQIPHSVAHISNGESGIIIQKSIRVKVNAGQPAVVAYAQQWGNARSAATLLLPTNVLGKQYYAMSFTQTGANNGSYLAKSQFQIIAVKPNTQVKITPRFNGVVGSAFIINFPQTGDMYQYQADQDITGTLIESTASSSGGCLPIAVFSGSSNLTFGTSSCPGGNSYDPLFQQQYPISSWGKNFGFVPFGDYPNGNPYRVLASEDNTAVYFDGSLVATLMAGQIYPSAFTASPVVLTQPTRITSDKPVCVAQYAQTQNCGGNGYGDPDMVILNPIEQNISDITIFSSSQQNITHQWVNVLIKTAAVPSFQINGLAPSAAFQTFGPLIGYSYLRELLPGAGSYRLSADSGFNAIAYGFSTNFESYAYSAGTNIRDLYTQLGFSTLYGAAASPAACIGTGSKFKISLPYKADSIYWNLNQLPGNPPDTITRYPPSTFDSTTIVNGKTLYWYSLPSYYFFTATGTYPVNITTFSPNGDGCGTEQEYAFDVEVYAKPIADFTFTTDGCVTNPVQFNDNSSPGGRPVFSRHWNFGDATISSANNPTHTYATAGAYTVKYSLITDIGCIADTASHVVNLSDPPVANFNATGPFCDGNTITFTDNSTAGITAWSWDFGDGNNSTVQNPTHTYAGPGVYTVSLTVSVGSCQSLPHTFNVTIYPNPVSDFSFPAAVCLPSGATQFTDLSTVTAGNTITGWEWNFGDGSPTSSLQNPLHIYTGTGPYTVSLKVTTNNGCVNIKQTIINTIYAEPQAAFNSLPAVCIGSLIGFSDASTAPGSTITGWTWNFGDGSPTSSLQNPSHIYAAAGTYTVTLNVTSAAGCQTVNNSASHNVTVHPLPAGNIAGNTVVCLNAPSPDVIFTGTVGTAPFTFTYNINGGTNLTVTTTSGNSVAVPVPTNIAMTYTYSLVTVQDGTASQCTQAQTGSATVTVKPLPTASISGNTSVCLNATSPSITFTGAGGTAPYTFIYTINNGPNQTISTTSGNSVSVTVPTGSANSFVYSLVSVQEGSGNLCAQSQTGSVTVTVNALPTASISGGSEVCLNAPSPVVTFTGALGTAPYTFVYNINNGPNQTISTTTTSNSVTLAVPTTTAGILNYNLVSVQEGSGILCSQAQTGSTTVTVNPLPTSDFNFSLPGCETRTISFTDISVANAGVLNSWQWNFGDIGSGGANTSTLQNPTHTFAAAGSYTVTLTVSTDKGCVSVAPPKSVVINARPKAGFIFPQACTSDPAAPFTDTSKVVGGTITGWEWDFGDPASGAANTSTLQNPTHGFTVMGSYTVRLIATSNNGCKDTVLQTFFVNGAVLNADFTVKTPGALCSNKDLVIEDASSVQGNMIKLEIYWDYLNDITVKTTVINPVAGTQYTHTYPEFGSPASKIYQVRYVAFSGTNCLGSVTRDITILATPTLAFGAVPAICSDAASFQVTQAQLLNGLPGPPGVFSGPGISATGLFSPATAGAGLHTIRYTFTGTNGCTNFKEQVIEVNQTPPVNAGPDKVVLEGGQVKLTPAQNAGLPITYLWTPSTGLSSTTIAEPNASPPDDITYTLTVTTDKGCSNSDKVFVKVLKAPAIPNIFSPNGDGVHDKWVIQFLESYPGCTVDIYNRYGQVVYHSVGYTNPWDGTVNGKPVPVGTYYYIVNPKNGRSQMSGYVDVIR